MDEAYGARYAKGDVYGTGKMSTRHAAKQIVEWLKEYANYNIDNIDFKTWDSRTPITFEIGAPDLLALLKLVEATK
jgi:hypothetical protein